MPKLTDIPREIRDQIYSYCLVVDGEIMPFNEHYMVPKDHHANPPSLSLLRVSKMIREEAVETFYRKNTWRIGPSAPTIRRSPDSWYLSRQLWDYYKYLFRHVVVYFSQFDINPASAYTYARLKNKEPVESNPQARKEMFHYANEAFMAATWGKKMEFVRDMTLLSSLTLDVDRLFCLSGCCRRIVTLKELLDDLKTDIKSLSDTGCTIRIRGLHNQDEVTQVLKDWPFVAVQQVSDKALNAA